MSKTGPNEVEQKLATGDVIEVTIRDASYVGIRNGNELVYTTLADGRDVEHIVHLGQGWPGHSITRVAPPAFPPEPGDLWRTWHTALVTDVHSVAVGERLIPETWVARRVSEYDPVLFYLVSGDPGDESDSRSPWDVAKESAKMPELLYRAGLKHPDSADATIYTVPGTEPREVNALQQEDRVVVDGEVRTVVEPPRLNEYTGAVELALASRHPNHSKLTESRMLPAGTRLPVVVGDLIPQYDESEGPVW